jgi:iron transport multicopper oxidase
MFVRCRQAHSQAFQGTFWYHSHFEAQYCDGLRGALIIDDPNDPQKSLYDVDNGEKDLIKRTSHRPKISSDATIITLADWYHVISTEAGLTP